MQVSKAADRRQESEGGDQNPIKRYHQYIKGDNGKTTEQDGRRTKGDQNWFVGDSNQPWEYCGGKPKKEI